MVASLEDLVARIQREIAPTVAERTSTTNPESRRDSDNAAPGAENPSRGNSWADSGRCAGIRDGLGKL
jgi:hypothetical protein